LNGTLFISLPTFALPSIVANTFFLSNPALTGGVPLNNSIAITPKE